MSRPEAVIFTKNRQPDLPVIICYGKVGEEVVVQRMKVGAAHYVMKDRLERLVPAVNELLRQAEARRT